MSIYKIDDINYKPNDFSIVNEEKKLDYIFRRMGNRKDIYKIINENKKKHKIKFVINSHIKYGYYTLSTMIPDLIRDVPNEHIIVVCGGANEEKIIKKEIDFALVPINAYDYHSFVFIVKNPDYFEGYDYIYYLHDTCLTLPFFYEMTYCFRSGVETCAMTNNSSSNIGLYKISYLMKKKDFIIDVLSNINSRKLSIRFEDVLFLDKKNVYNTQQTVFEPGLGDKLIQAGKSTKPVLDKGRIVGWKDWDGSGQMRRVVYWKNSNLCKFKSPTWIR